MATAKPKPGCGRNFAFLLVLEVIFWIAAAVAFAFIQSSGAVVTVSGSMGSATIAQKVPFLQALFTSSFVFGIVCLGSTSALALMFLLFRARAKSAGKVIS